MCHFLPVYHLGIVFWGWVEGSKYNTPNSALNGCWGVRTTAGSWMTQSAQKRDWKCSDQRLKMEGLICKKHFPICTVQESLDPVSRAIHCLESFIETSLVPKVCWVLFAGLVHHSFWISRSLRWRMLQMKRKASYLTGYDSWARWNW